MTSLAEVIDNAQMQKLLWSVAILLVAFGAIDRKSTLVLIGLALLALGFAVPVG